MRPLLLLLVLTACHTERLNIVSECGKPCYPDKVRSDAGVVGECQMGVLQCDDDGGTKCVGYVLPKHEECNGLDDDCDGTVDNNIRNDPQICYNACGIGIQECKRGQWTACSAPSPKPEICNGVDDDCDGLIDEPEDIHIPDGGTDLSCFTAPAPANPSLGICHGGTYRCVAGQYLCYGQQVPMPEICNGLDDNCDGAIDNGAAPTDFLDLVLVFDNSGSMLAVAGNLKTATNTWAAKYTSTQRRYALVVAPDNNDLITYPRIYQDFTDPAAFALAMNDQTGETGIGAEPTLDAIEQILKDQYSHDMPNRNGTRGLSWRAGSKRVIVMFSDEEPQAYFFGGTYGGGGCYGGCPASVTNIENSLTVGSVSLQVFTRTDPLSWNAWKPIAGAGRGKVWDIEASTGDLGTDLDDMLKEAACQ